MLSVKRRSDASPSFLSFLTMTAVINSRAKLPARLKAFSALHSLDFKSLLSVNPKTEKSAEHTRILHLSPADSSGHQVCAGAGNCKKICLHFAGNPVNLPVKIPARLRKTLAFFNSPQLFLELVVTSLLYSKFKINWEFLAARLNGTSDLPWETFKFTVTPEISQFWKIKFGVYIVPTEYKSIIHMFAHYPELGVKFYDYTKIKRDWQECKAIGYHLTFSYDGANNKQNHKIAASAINAGLNVAAAFNVKKGQPLPKFVRYQGRKFWVIDGDLTDYRPGDRQGLRIVGLRFKLPHGVNWTPDERDAFCLG